MKKISLLDVIVLGLLIFFLGMVVGLLYGDYLVKPASIPVSHELFIIPDDCVEYSSFDGSRALYCPTGILEEGDFK